MSKKEVLLDIKNAKTHFPIKDGVLQKTVGYVKAVDGIDLTIYKGETLGLVGESGCGKTTFGKSILQLTPITEGEYNYNFDGEFKNLPDLDKKEMDDSRKKIQIVFQDPQSSLNPAFTVFGSLQDPLKRFGVKSREERLLVTC